MRPTAAQTDSEKVHLQGLLEVSLIANDMQQEWQAIPQVRCSGSKAGIAELLIGLRSTHGACGGRAMDAVFKIFSEYISTHMKNHWNVVCHRF